MAYCVRTRNRGATLKPNCEWNGKKDFKFMIDGRSDSNYATNPDTRKSVTGCHVLLNRAPVAWRSSTKKHVTLSVTEAEMGAGRRCDLCTRHDVCLQPDELDGLTGTAANGIGDGQSRGC